MTTYHVASCEWPEGLVAYLNPVRWSISHFVNALADCDAKALAEHVQLSFERRYPIPKITTMEEFVAAIPSLMGEDAVKRLSESSAFRDWDHKIASRLTTVGSEESKCWLKVEQEALKRAKLMVVGSASSTVPSSPTVS